MFKLFWNEKRGRAIAELLELNQQKFEDFGARLKETGEEPSRVAMCFFYQGVCGQIDRNGRS